MKFKTEYRKNKIKKEIAQLNFSIVILLITILLIAGRINYLTIN